MRTSRNSCDTGYRSISGSHKTWVGTCRFTLDSMVIGHSDFGGQFPRSIPHDCVP